MIHTGNCNDSTSVRATAKVPVRSNRLMFKKYTQYLIPTMITYAALSLNEFADSLLISNLLGSEAMSIVNMGMPIMLVMSAAYALFGSGGATVYAIAIGGRDHEKAGKSMTASVVIAFLTGVLIVLFGSVFSSQITVLLCRNPMLHIQFEKYLLVLLLAAPLEIVVLTFVSILPAAGYPGFLTAVNVIANVVNIAMDYVNIHYFHMNVEGAAWATLTGYVCAALLVLFALAIRKIKIARILERNGFIRMSAETSRISLNRGYTKEGFADKVYHIHLRYAGDNDELYFRDFLNEHPRIAGEYESLKLKLWKRYEHDRDAYTHEKTEFIRKWTAEARRIYGDRYL